MAFLCNLLTTILLCACVIGLGRGLESPTSSQNNQPSAGDIDFSQAFYQSVFASVIHSVKEDFDRKFNQTNIKLHQALSEIERLKKRDQELNEKINHLNQLLESLQETVNSKDKVSTPFPVTRNFGISTSSSLQNSTHGLETHTSMNVAFTTTSSYLRSTQITEHIVNSECLLDVIFLIDGSESIGYGNFQVLKNWTIALVESLNTEEGAIQFGFVQYSHFFRGKGPGEQEYLTTEIALGHYSNTDFKKMVDAISYHGYTTYTAAALRKVQTDFRSSTNFNNPNNQQILILVTDGNATDSLDLSTSAQELCAMGVIPFAIGVADAGTSGLCEIATGDQSSAEQVAFINEFSQISSLTIPIKTELEQYRHACVTKCLMDVIFLIDGSASVGQENFEVLKDWIKTVAERISAKVRRTQYGVVQFSYYNPSFDINSQQYIHTEIPLGHYSNTDIKKMVDAIQYHGYTTFTAAALRKVQSDFQNSTNFNNSNNQQLLILITDGMSNDEQNLKRNAEELRAMGIISFAVGIGNADTSELREVATGQQNGDEQVFYVPDFDSIKFIVDSLVNEVSYGHCIDRPVYLNVILDVIFVVDGSGSVGETNFNLYKKWLIQQTMELYSIYGYGVQVEVMQYSNKDPTALRIPIEESSRFEIPIKLGECVFNYSCVKSKIENMPYLGGQTFTEFALRRAMEWEFLQSKRSEESQKFIVLLTDGQANDSSLLQSWYERYGATGRVIPFVIGLGVTVDQQELRVIANGGVSNERVFISRNATLDINIYREIAAYVKLN